MKSHHGQAFGKKQPNTNNNKNNIQKFKNDMTDGHVIWMCEGIRIHVYVCLSFTYNENRFSENARSVSTIKNATVWAPTRDGYTRNAYEHYERMPYGPVSRMAMAL